MNALDDAVRAETEALSRYQAGRGIFGTYVEAVRQTARMSVLAAVDAMRFLTVTVASGPRSINLAQVEVIAPEPDGRTHIRFAGGNNLVVQEDFDRLAALISWEPDWSEVGTAEAGAA